VKVLLKVLRKACEGFANACRRVCESVVKSVRWFCEGLARRLGAGL
jgi:hypothetical protein